MSGELPEVLSDGDGSFLWMDGGGDVAHAQPGREGQRETQG